MNLSGIGCCSAIAATTPPFALDAIHDLDVPSRRARVGAAVRLGDLARAAEERGLLFAHDPWSRDLASVGGAELVGPSQELDEHLYYRPTVPEN